MSIVVYWKEATGQAAMQEFEQGQLSQALQLCELKRREGKRHVCISSEMADSVGQDVVSSVEGKRLPNGSEYDWSKSHRGAGPGIKQERTR